MVMLNIKHSGMQEESKIKKMKKMSLETYPYTYARVSAMKAKLIKKEDYIKLFKMDTSSIIRFLEETEYKKSIDKLASAYTGVDLVEYAINDHLLEIVNKLKSISEVVVVELIEAYLKRWDALNLKTILRIKNRNQSQNSNAKKIDNLIVPLGALDKKVLVAMLNMSSIADILKKIKNLGYNINIEEFEKTKDLAIIENHLDKDFFYKTISFADRIPKDGERFKAFLKIEIDIINIMTLLKLKRINTDKSKTLQFLIFSGQNIGKKELESLAGANDIENLLNKLRGTKYSRIFDRDHSIVDIELELYRHWLKNSALYSHQNPLSVQTILAYLLAKDIEARNIKAIVRGKQLGIPEEYIEKKILI